MHILAAKMTLDSARFVAIGVQINGKAGRDATDFQSTADHPEDLAGIRVKHSTAAIAWIDRQLHEVV